MATQASRLQDPRLRAMVVPREHGAWGMLLVPLVTGAAVAARGSIDFVALGLFSVASLALFWMRTPLEAWLGTSPIKAQTKEERRAVARVAIRLALVATVAIGALFYRGLITWLLIVGAISALAFGLQALVKRTGRSGRMPAQIIGAIGLTSTAAGAYYVCSHGIGRVGLAVWLANWLFAANQVHFVQVRIRGSRLCRVNEKLQHAKAFIAGQVFLVAGIAACTHLGFFPKFTLVAFAPVLVRGFRWFFEGAKALDVHKLGFSELKHALVFGALLCVAFLV